MSAVLAILQGFLAFHTVAGALWKFANPVEAVPTLTAIPPVGWRVVSVLELVIALLLVLPAFVGGTGLLAVVGMGLIALEMLGFVALHLRSGASFDHQVKYWLGVAGFCGLLMAGRLLGL